MTNDELREYNKNRKIVQIGFFVRDLEKAMDMWIEKLNIGPFTTLTLDETNTKDVIEQGVLSDKPFKMKVAAAFVGDNLHIELIQPCYGIKIYDDWLEKYGEGFSHLKEYTPDLEEMEKMVENYTAKGVKLVRGGNLNGDVHRYLDFSDSLGLIWELGNCPEDVELPEGMLGTYPEE